jgi:hypothetical protein
MGTSQLGVDSMAVNRAETERMDIRDDAHRVLEQARKDDREATELLLTVKEYAAIFRRHPQTVYTAIRSGSLPYPVERPTGGSRVLIRVPADVVVRTAASHAA